mgnify:CR=1 FL=1
MTDNAQAWTVYNSLMVDPLTHTVYSAGEEVHLPEMEYQLLYYMFYLKHEKDIKNVVGFLNYPDSRKKKKITLTKEKERDLFEIIDNIKNIVDSSMPKPKKKRICSKCAYFEFCFS